MRIQELLEVGLLPSPAAGATAKSAGGTGLTLGQKYAGILDPNNVNAGLKSRLISTKPKDIAATAAANKASLDAKIQGIKDRSQARQTATPADKVADLQPIGTSGTAQQQAQTGKFSQAKANATDVQFKDVPADTTQTKTPSTKVAPSLGAPAAVDKQAKQGGFFSGLASGFKQGMGMDDEKGIISNLAGSALKSAGMKNTAAAATGQIDPQTYIKQVLNKGQGQAQQQQPQQLALPKPGQMIADPLLGRGKVKVLPNPGGKGIKLDTTKTLGYPITIDPKDMQ